MNNTSIPPIIIKNKIYLNQKFKLNSPVIKAVRMVWIKRIIPIDNGCFIKIKIIDIIIVIDSIIMIQRIVYKNINFGD